MKKISLLLLACVAAFSVAVADEWDGNVQYPANYPTGTAAFGWGDFMEPTGVEPVSATAIPVSGIFGELNNPGGFDFEDLWTSIQCEASPLDQMRSDAADCTGAKAAMGFFKVTADDENIIIFVRFDDETSVNGATNFYEVMISPYYSLTGYTGSFTGVPYGRFANMGGGKYEVMSTGLGGFCSVNAVDENTFGLQFPALPSYLESLDFTVFDQTEGTSFRRVFVLPYAALNDNESERDFSDDVWKKINGGNGIALTIKYNDKANGNGEYLSSTTNNNVYITNVGAGYLKLGEPIGTEDVEAAVKNMSIAGNQIILAEAADVEIINAATGIVVLKVSNETSILLSGLESGIYIAKSGSEVIKFVK